MRPVEWLLTQAQVDARWCIVHATHMTEKEIAALAAAAPSRASRRRQKPTWAMARFPARRTRRREEGSASAAIPIPSSTLLPNCGSSNGRSARGCGGATCSASAGDLTLGTSLWTRAASAGAQALARKTGAIEAGRRADFVVLDVTDPALLNQVPEDVLDAAIFGPARRPVRDVMIGGRWVVREGRHVAEDEVLERYRAALARMAVR